MQKKNYYYTNQKMKENIILILLSIILINQTISIMSEEERKNLLNKYTKKISLENSFTSEINSLKQKYYSQNVKDDHMTYDVEAIDAIIDKYGFPKDYNYLNETSCPTVVKDQGRCGCCWSHAATTSLAYRYHKIGVEVDLSPQDALSCYLKDCDAGNFLIDPELNLVKNGTVTEGCLPFSSADGKTIESCPTSCKDGSKFKKYYAQNAYMTEGYYSQETFYDIVTLMMDQIVNYGPIVTGIDVYMDFQLLHYDSEKCRNEVYTYDGTSEYLGGHAIVIVGYGYMDSKYYWLIQNSWGEDACDHGFVKVEFGQIGVEQISFVEPYIESEGVTPTNIPLQFKSIDEECNIEVTTDATSLKKWQNSVDIEFKHTEINRKFNYQCSAVNIIDEKKTICYYEYWNYWAYKGIYKYNTFNSLGVENTFTLSSSFNDKQFEFYGFDELYPIFTNYLYVSEEGSKIVFFYQSDNMEDEINIPQIYANSDSPLPLSDCGYFNNEDDYFIYCNLKKDEIDYFDDMSTMNINPLASSILCGMKYPFDVVVYKLDKTIYPVIKLKNIILPEGETISSKSILTGVADIEGSLSGYNVIQNIFYVFSELDVYGMNLTTFIYCEFDQPRKIMNDYYFNCHVDMASGYNVPYDNLYVYPYSFPQDLGSPFEICIKDTIKAQKPTKYIPKIEVYIESLCPDCVNFITKSFKEFYEKVKNPNIVEIDFIPYGNAHESFNTSTNKYDFTCQHGENECYGNLIETCAIQTQGRIKSYEIILCIESNIAYYSRNFDITLEFCLSNEPDKLQEIKDCIESDMGNYYEHQMAQKTDVSHNHVPWVVVDGIHDEETENQIIKSLIDYLCGDDKTKCYGN